MKKIVLSILMLLASFSLMATNSQPNILFILTDDMGYSDVGFNQVENSPVKDIVTPNIDALANDGTIFSSAYAVHMFCGPSRAGLMTGRYPHKIGSQFNLAAFSDHGVTADETFLSQVLHDAGYYTSIIGKWHLGEEEEHHPNNRGYDHFYGFLGGGHRYFSQDWKTIAQTENAFATAADGSFAEYSVSLMRNKNFVPNPSENLYLTDMLTAEGVSVLDSAQAKDQPFFLFMSYNAPHTLLEAKDADISTLKAAPYNITFADEDRATYSAMMFALDKEIKVLIDALKAKGMYDNTLIVFMSDNGGKLTNNASANNHPLKGGKGDIDEGGVRVPMFMHWPERMAAAPKQYDYVVSGLDLYPTFVALAHGTIPEGKALDGKDIFSHVMANTDVRPDEAVFNLRVQSPNNWVQARKGKYKVKTKGDGTWILHDLDADITENSTVNNAEILKELAAEAKVWAQTHVTPQWFDNPTYNWESKWNTENMPNWERTFPDDIGELPEGVVPVGLSWKGSAKNDLPIEQGQEVDVTFTYNSGIASTAYLLLESKTGGSWGDVWFSQAVDLVPGNGNSVDITVSVPQDLPLNNAVRVYMASVDKGGFSKRLLPQKLIYADVIAAAGTGGNTGGGDAFAISSFTWEDGSKKDKLMPEGTSLKAKLTYTNAQATDKLYAIITYKDGGSYGASTAQVEISFAAGSGDVLVDIPSRSFSTSDTDANAVRVTLGAATTAGWGDRFDVGADGSSGNDVIYGVVTGDGTGGNTGGNTEGLSLTNFKWEDGSNDDFVLSANATATLKFSYANATALDTLYLRVASKDNWGAFWLTEMITFEDAAGDTTIDFTVRAYDASNADANRARAMLTRSASGVWGDRFDLGADSNAGNDAIYGNIVEGSSAIASASTAALKVYPNPSRGQFTLDLPLAGRYVVYDLAGKAILNQQASIGLNTFVLDVAGTYILNVQDQDGLRNAIIQVK